MLVPLRQPQIFLLLIFLIKLYEFSYIFVNLYTGFYNFTYMSGLTHHFIHNFKGVFMHFILVLSPSFKNTE